MSNSELLKFGIYRSVSCAPCKRLFQNNWSDLFKNHQIDLSCSFSATVIITDSLAAELA